MSQSIDVTGIGNAIVDVIAKASDAFIESEKLNKGGMALIDAERAEALYGKMGPGVEVSGGSVANTVAAVAALGGKAAYIGKVRDDQLGGVFAHDIRATGVHFETPRAAEGAPTARCLILVTPDAQRTMNTFLGACVQLGPEDVDEALVRKSTVTYLEGYLWDQPRAKEAMTKAANVAHAAGQQVSLSLSDAFCVDGHRDEFQKLVDHHVDVLFANESEICSLYETSDFEEAARAVKGKCATVVLTRGPKGAVVLDHTGRHEVSAEPVERIIDTTGAGDLFAAGFLYGYTRERSAADCARMGALCAAEIISHFGARPEADLRVLLQRRLA